MKGYKMRHTLITLFSFAVFAILFSCEDKGTGEQPDAPKQQVTTVSVLCQQRKAAPGIETFENDNATDGNESTNSGADASIISNDFTEGSLLYFSQLGPTGSPNFENEEPTASPYLYIYEYKEDKDGEANWNEGYNFSTLEDRQPLEWETVRKVGSVGNAFSLYAFYFPVDNKVKFSVEQNQRTKEDFMKSDIMGAYHATSSLYTRLRFRLFHLMVYLKVTLYVPVYEDTKEGDNISYSGFYKDAVQGAFVMNAHTGFSIEWRANRSSDTEAPLTQPAGKKANIAMFGPLSNEEKTEIEVKNYYTKEDLGTDRVRVYNFSVLFPAQTFGDNFLCFALKTPNETMKYYYFSGSQIIGESENYSLTQGTLQQLYLYLPRKTNETILVGAKILPWKDAVTDMTVTKQDSNQDNKDGDRND